MYSNTHVFSEVLPFNMNDALEFNYEQWLELFSKWNEPKFRTDQVCQWIYTRKIFNYHDMSNLSKSLREKMSINILITLPILIKQSKSKDGTIKFLWQLKDNCKVESVLLNHGSYKTACISTQVGCAMGCVFCATGAMGFTRNLTQGEILGQFLMMEKLNKADINNIVFMGMGEPFLNQDNLFAAIRILNNPKMRNLGARHITISTSGIVPGIEKLSEFEIPVRLSVSLHAPNDEIRSKIMPTVNKNYPLQKLIDALKIYKAKTGERITFEYAMIDGVNDKIEHAYELAALLDGIQPYINLIPLNNNNNLNLRRSKELNIKEFGRTLKSLNIEHEIRKERGSDIEAACGQLAAKK